MARRHYSDADRAAALAVLVSNGGSLAQTSRATGVPFSTLKGWAAAPDRAAPADVRDEKKVSLADILKDVAIASLGLQRDALAYLEAMPQAERGKAALDRLGDLNRVSGTAIDKHQLVSGEPTERVETRDTTETERRAARILKLVDHAGDETTGKRAKSA